MNSYIQKYKDNKSLILLIGMIIVMIGFVLFLTGHYTNYLTIELVGIALLAIGVIIGIIGYVQYSVNLFKRLKEK